MVLKNQPAPRGAPPAGRTSLGTGLSGILGLLALTAPAAWAVDDGAASPDSLVTTDRLIVKFRPGTVSAQAGAPERLGRVSALAGTALSRVRAMGGGAEVLRLPFEMPLAEAEAVARRLAADPAVEYAEPDRKVRPVLDPDDPRFFEQWNFYDTFGVQAPDAWELTTGAPQVVIAVLDTGITAHPDLPGLGGRLLPGYDFVSDPQIANDGGGRDPDPTDPGDWVTAAEIAAVPNCKDEKPANSSWHGTFVTGVIAADGDDGAGVAGLNWDSQVLPVRVLGRCGGFTSDVADGMRWAAGLDVPGMPANPTPADVLNISLGGVGACTQTEQAAINAVRAAGKSVVTASGNSGETGGSSDNFSPASCNGVITVAATTREGGRAPISNVGAGVALSAPGGSSLEGILSTDNAGTTGPQAPAYGFRQGTSIATAHVTGVVSLMLSVQPGLSPDQVRSILRATAAPFPEDSDCTTATCGAGIVDAAAAVSEAAGTPPTPPAQAGGDQGGGGGGGGCQLARHAGFDPTLALALLAGLWSVRRRA